MKTNRIVIVIYFFLFCQQIAYSQSGQWTWMNGDSTTNSLGVFGTQGVPSVNNTPPGLYEACEWTDLQGNFWLYGGASQSFDANSFLWKYNPLTNEWTWMSGNSGFSTPVYGIQGVPSIYNNPGARGWGVATWIDTIGNLWLFGGNGIDTSGGMYSWKTYNDLWKYNIASNEWTWMKGSNIPNQPGIYGNIGISASANTPSSRAETSCTWKTGNSLWLFGGQNWGNRDDLWKYNILTNEWTWMKGSTNNSQMSIYGTMGIEDSLNTPGFRMVYSRWKDNCNNLWLFGGWMIYSHPNCYNDVWKYNISTNNWTWESGSNLLNDTGIYNGFCNPSTVIRPYSRFENRSCWTDKCGNLWTFGGAYEDSIHFKDFNDLWHFNITTKKWTLVSGSTLADQAGSFGAKTIYNSTNMPGHRFGALPWSDTQGNLWLFGGRTSYQYRNDLWRYTPDTNCPAISCQGTICNNKTICKGDTVLLTSSGGLSYLWNTGATNSSIFVHPLTTTTYIVNINTQVGCSVNRSVTVFVNNPPIVNLGNDTTICKGDSVILRAIAFLSGAWEYNQNFENIVGNEWTDTNRFNFNSTNVLGPFGNDTVNLNLNNLPIHDSVEVSFDLYIHDSWDTDNFDKWRLIINNDTILNTSFNNHTSGFQSYPGQIPSINPPRTGSFSILPIRCSAPYTCTSLYKITLNIANLTNTLQINFEGKPDQDVCDESWSLDNVKVKLLNVKYATHLLWSTNDTTQFIIVSPLQTTIYSVKCTSSNGCNASDTLKVNVIPKPIVNLGNDTTICQGSSLSLNANNAGSTYLWQDASVNSIFNVSQQGTYWVKVTTNGCSSVDSINVSYHSLPQINLGNDTTLCQGEIFLLDATMSNVNYQWQDGSTNPTYSVNQQGIYWVKLTNQYNCFAYDSISIQFIAAPIVNFGNDTVLCNGEHLLLNAANANATYQWQDGSGNPTYNVIAQGTYFVKVTNQFNCPNSDTINVSYSFPFIVNLGADTTLCLGSTITLEVTNPNSSYLWQDNSINSSYIVNQQGIYWVKVKDYNKCPVSDTIIIYYYDCDTSEIFIPNIITPNGDGVNDYFVITKTEYKNIEVQIYDRWGVKVYDDNAYKNSWNGKYRGNPLAEGTYYYVIKAKGLYNKKEKEYHGSLTILR
ncbi:MAG: gliding motility-associated C-terminal domain-containing protein [Bacteroidales bacterium]